MGARWRRGLLLLALAACSSGSWRERFLQSHPYATQQEVQATLGRPLQTLVRGDETVWTYVEADSSDLSFRGVDRSFTKTTVYVLTFNPDGVLVRWRRENR